MIYTEENDRFADDCQVTLNQFSVFQGAMMCCSCMNNGTCIRCSCVTAKKRCIDCRPSRNGRCQNQNLTHCDGESLGEFSDASTQDISSENTMHVEHVHGHLYGFSDQKIYLHFLGAACGSPYIVFIWTSGV